MTAISHPRQANYTGHRILVTAEPAYDSNTRTPSKLASARFEGAHAPTAPFITSRGTMSASAQLDLDHRARRLGAQRLLYSMTQATPSILRAGTLSGAVIGTWDFSTLDTSAARFHGNRVWDPKSGGNYGYSDGHVEYLRWVDLKVRPSAPDTDPGRQQDLPERSLEVESRREVIQSVVVNEQQLLSTRASARSTLPEASLSLHLLAPRCPSPFRAFEKVMSRLKNPSQSRASGGVALPPRRLRRRRLCAALDGAGACGDHRGRR